jgi:hypothetical protein
MIWPEPKNVWSTAFILYTATLGFFGPLFIICLCYLLIVIKVPYSFVCVEVFVCVFNVPHYVHLLIFNITFQTSP